MARLPSYLKGIVVVSKFDDVLNSRKRRTAAAQDAKPKPEAGARAPAAKKPHKASTAEPSANELASTPRRRGRPAGGRRSSADYVPITGYIPKDLYFDLNIARAEEAKEMGEQREYSELIEELLKEWLKSRK